MHKVWDICVQWLCTVHDNHCQYQDEETHLESVLIGSSGGFVALCLII